MSINKKKAAEDSNRRKYVLIVVDLMVGGGIGEGVLVEEGCWQAVLASRAGVSRCQWKGSRQQHIGRRRVSESLCGGRR